MLKPYNCGTIRGANEQTFCTYEFCPGRRTGAVFWRYCRLQIAKQKESKDMVNTREELIERIEMARQKLNDSIDKKERYDRIYQYSIELDELLNQYVVAEA